MTAVLRDTRTSCHECGETPNKKEQTYAGWATGQHVSYTGQSAPPCCAMNDPAIGKSMLHFLHFIL